MCQFSRILEVRYLKRSVCSQVKDRPQRGRLDRHASREASFFGHGLKKQKQVSALSDALEVVCRVKNYCPIWRIDLFISISLPGLQLRKPYDNILKYLTLKTLCYLRQK